MVQVKPCGLQTEQIAGINVSVQRCYLRPCSRDRTVLHISAFLSTKVCRQKTIFYWKSYRQASTFNPELALQCLSDSPEEFKADRIFLCVCLLSYLWSPSGGRDLPSTNTNAVWLQIFEEAIAWFLSTHITGRCKEPAQFCLLFNTWIPNAWCIHYQHYQRWQVRAQPSIFSGISTVSAFRPLFPSPIHLAQSLGNSYFPALPEKDKGVGFPQFLLSGHCFPPHSQSPCSF